MRTIPGRPEATQPVCQRVAQIRRIETPMIAELVAAMFHLEHLVETAGTPEQEAAAHRTPLTVAAHRSLVLGNVDRIRRALDVITVLYTSQTATAPPQR